MHNAVNVLHPRDEGGGREEEKRIVVGEKTGMKGRMRDEGKY